MDVQDSVQFVIQVTTGSYAKMENRILLCCEAFAKLSGTVIQFADYRSPKLRVQHGFTPTRG